MKGLLKRMARTAGYEIVNLRRPQAASLFPADFDDDVVATFVNIRPFTQTSPERVFTLVRAVEYLVRAEVPSAFVECGVWKGGSMMAVARTLMRIGRTDRDLLLFDTFEGMPPPVPEDGDYARDQWEKHRDGDRNAWNNVPLDEVRHNMAGTGYPAERVHYVVGKVEDTLPARAPEQVALLRLDTDFYESTRHELVHLYPRLSRGGVLIIDDYGTFPGARKAVDEYLRDERLPLFLNRIDADSRLAVKP